MGLIIILSIIEIGAFLVYFLTVLLPALFLCGYDIYKKSGEQ